MGLEFDKSVRGYTPATHQVLLTNFEEVTKEMQRQSIGHKFIWNRPDEPIPLLNHYLNILWSVHVSKFSELCQALIDAVNRQEFITYGLIGRSLIEHAAVMRYYFRQHIRPMVKDAMIAGSLSGKQFRAIILELDLFLRGRRFNWEAFLAGKFDELLSKKNDTAAEMKQVNVLTCVEKWANEVPPAMVLYDLFCDLVHPNIGSTLLIMKKWPDGAGFGGKDGEPAGQDIFIVTFAGLVGLFADIQIHLNDMLFLQVK